jgi:hypothetical protein
MIDFSGGEHRERGPHMMTMKKVVRDQHGQIVSVLERTLTPTQQEAVLAYEQLERISRRVAQPHYLWIDTKDISPDIDLRELAELVGGRAAADPEFWSRSGWKSFRLLIGGPRPWEVARPTPVPSATPIGFRVTKNSPGASR